MVKFLGQLIGYFLIGVVMLCGMRTMEWLIPAPETRVVVCTADELYKVKECRSLAEATKWKRM